MKLPVSRIVSAAVFAIGASFGFSTSAQQPAAPLQVVQITGLVGVKPNTKGNLTMNQGSLEFANKKSKATVSISSLQDVVTGNDSQRYFHGTLGNLTYFAPYGGGRFLSLFRSKLDTITIQYLDSDGALHGAIFTLPVGKADPLKQALVAQGAHTSIPPADDPKSGDVKSQSNGGKPQ